jgi:uncharacterized membrane protein YfcA
MTDQEGNKYYWSAGVTKNEVIESLNDNRPSIFRNQFNRRALVLVAAVSLVGLSLVFCIPQPKLKSYLEIVLLLIVLLLYFQLRKSVRNVADAPDELLDERQIAIRNLGYLHAYRWLSALMLIYAVVFIGIYEIFLGNSNWVVHIKFTQPIIAFCMWVACLPSMVLAWQLPTEQFIPEESK